MKTCLIKCSSQSSLALCEHCVLATLPLTFCEDESEGLAVLADHEDALGLPTPPGTPESEEAVEEVPEHPLWQTTEWVHSRAVLQCRINMTDEAERHGVSRKTFVQRIHTICEASLRCQSATLAKLLHYVRGGVAAGRVQVTHDGIMLDVYLSLRTYLCKKEYIAPP